MEPASADTGFFQQLPVLKNQFLHDPSIRRIFKLFVPADVAQAVTPEITRLGDEVLQQRVFDWATDAERNTPYIAGGGRNAFGQQVSSKLVVAEGWRKLQAFSIEKGFVAQGYEANAGLHQHTRVVQYLRELIFESSSANVGCPAAMSDGAARVLQHHLHLHNSNSSPNSKPLSPSERKVFENAYTRLTSRDPTRAWTSGQWMTERIGGSDVSRSETVATYAPLLSKDDEDSQLCDPEDGIPLGPWKIDGFKWFSSATDSNMTILLAQTPKGLSMFFAPMRRHNPNPSLSHSPSSSVSATTNDNNSTSTELNGVTISRLKNKLGTKSLPTAELQLRGMRGWLIGVEGQGVKEIAAILTITRVRTAVGALGYLSRGLCIARAFAEVREVGAGKGGRMRLVDSKLHMRTLADMGVEHHGMMLLTFYCCYLLGLEEHPSSSSPQRPAQSSSPPSPPSPPSPGIAPLTPPQESVTPLLRVLTPLLKAYVTKQTIPLLYACMESLGGVGYLENSESEHMNVARLFRDACVLNIWEGTTDVLGTDLVRALKHPKGGGDSIRALEGVLRSGEGDGEKSVRIAEQWEVLRGQIEKTKQEDLVQDARGILWKLAELLMGVLFLVDVKSDDGPVVREMCERYFASRRIFATTQGKRANIDLNRAIVFGGEYTAERGAKL